MRGDAGSLTVSVALGRRPDWLRLLYGIRRRIS